MHKSKVFTDSGVKWIRRAFFFRPLAVLLALLTISPEWGGLGQKAQAATFIVQPGCFVQGGTWIIQQVCSVTQSFQPEIQQWEQDSVQQYLSIYGLPNSPSDVALVYQYARTDLRSAISGFMMARMLSMAEGDPSQLTQNEAYVLQWFRARWATHEYNLYSSALANYNAWAKNPCTWKPDPDIAKVVKLNYIACVGTIAARNAPSADYYLLAARKGEYEALLANLHKLAANSNTSASGSKATTSGPSPSGFTLFSTNGDYMYAAAGSLVGVAVLGTLSAIVAKTVPQLQQAIFPTARANALINKIQKLNVSQQNQNLVNQEKAIEQDASQQGDTEAADEAAEVGSEASEEFVDEATIEATTTLEVGADSAPETLGIGLIVAAVVLAVSLAITLSVDEATAVKQVGGQLQTFLTQQEETQGQVNIPDMLSSSEGMYKYQVVWTEALYPAVPSSTPLPAPDASTKILVTPAGQTQPQLGATYQDWAGYPWTVGLYHGFFDNSGTKNVTVNGTTSSVSYDSFSPTIRYLDWQKNQFFAARMGNNFLVFKRNYAGTDTVCAASALTGLSDPSVDPTTCVSRITNTLNVLDANGNQVTWQVGTAPVFTTQTGQSFTNTSRGWAALATATGYPTPQVTWPENIVALNGNLESGFPSGITFQNSGLPPGYAQFNCCDFPTQPATPPAPGTYSTALQATNIVGTTVGNLTFTLTQNQGIPVSINYLGGTATPHYGQSANFYWNAAGGGPYKFYTNMTILGMTFSDNGAGWAQFSGVPANFRNTCPSAAQGGCQIWVSNDGTESFTADNNHAAIPFNFQGTPSPSATLAGPTTFNFPLGLTTSYMLTSTGASTPVSYQPVCGTPSWLTLTDNGNSTATLTGSPGTSDAASGLTGGFELAVNADGAGGSFIPNCANPNITVTIDPTLKVLSANSATFKTLTDNSFTIQSNTSDGGIVLDSPLPSSLQFLTFPNGTGLITGSPDALMGGDYMIQYHLTPGSLGGTNYYPPPLRLTINELPQISLPYTIYAMAGVAQNIVIKPTGFPSLNAMTVALANGILPAGLSGSSVAEITAAPGTYTISGIPAAAAAGQSSQLQFTATNPLGSAETVTTLQVVPAGDVNHDNATNCADYSMVKSLLNVSYTSPNYVAAADINGDGVINILDLAFVSANLPKGTACH